MEKITQRALYSSHFYEFCQKVELKPEFIDGLKNHRYFREDMNTVLVCYLSCIFTIIIEVLF